MGIFNNKFRNKLFAFFIGRVIFTLSQFLFIVILARLGNAEQVGIFGLAIAVTGPVFMFFSMQLRTLLATDIDDKRNVNHYIGLALFNIILAIVAVIIYLFFLEIKEQTILVVSAYCLAKIVQTIFEILYGDMQRREEIHIIGLSNLIKGVVSAVVFGVTFKVTSNLTIATFSIGLSWLLVMLCFDLQYAKTKINIKSVLKTYKHNYYVLKKLFLSALPLGFISLLYSLNTNITRYQITDYHNEELLGYFTAASYLMMAGNTLIGSLGQSYSSKMARYSSNKGNFVKLLIKLVLFGLGLGVISTIVILFAGSEIISLVFGEEYSRYAMVFTILIGTTIFRYPSEFMGYATVVTRKYIWEVPLLILTLIVTFSSGLILIPDNELIGAAISVLLGSAISSIGRAIIIIYTIRGKRG